jgi:CYTH domain-containing protein
MGIEIERKFLLKNDVWRDLAEGVYYRQGYLNSVRERTVRVRTINEKGFLTIKGVADGITRLEFEYEIPKDECNIMLDELVEKPVIEKNRYKVDYKGFVWEIDEFFGENRGLIVAELELESEGQKFEIPEWIGEEVTDDPRYFNSNLINHPYTKW